MKYLYILLLSIFALSGFAKLPPPATDYNMNNGSVTVSCGSASNFYDSGGSGGNYGPSESFTMTFCPSVAGDKLNFNFTAFNMEGVTWESLKIYDGPNTSAPTLGTYASTTGPGIVQATGTNTSGCITFVFKSDGILEYSGWAASITCVTPCETINSVLNSSTPAPVGGIIKVCQGQSVSFTGSGTFSSGSSAGAAYSWTFDNGLTGSGTSTSTTFTAPGVYVVNLNINKAGCINYNKINQIVQVSTTPSFSSTTTSTTSICLGQTATLIGSVTPTPFVAICTPPVTGTTFLPDGAGNSYSTSIVVDCYGSSQTVTSASDINNICMSLEHSYLGDLHIEIICPNGQIVPLKTYASGGSGTYLGNPFDDVTSGPGTGSNYCFAMSGATTLVGGPTVSSGSPAGNSIAAGTYSPAGNFSGLVGCPLNGSWTIKITDNLGSDDGYIFNWDVNFNATVPASQSFTPTIVSQTWSGANITSTSGNNAVITPTSTGTKCYTLTAVDNFGCSYTTVRCVTVTAGPYAGVNNTLTVCANGASSNLFPLLGAGTATNGAWTGPSALAGGNLGAYNPVTLTAGNYTYTVPGAGSCPADIAVITVVENPLPAATLSFTNPTCGNTNGIVTINNTSGAGQSPFVFASSLGAISGQTVTGLGAGTPVITLTNNFGCTFTVSATLTMTPGPTAIAISFTNATCGNNNGIITFGTPTGGTGPFTYSVNNVSSTSPKTVLAPGTYSVTVRDVNGCVFTATTVITNISGPTAITGTTTQASCNTNNGTHNVTGVTGGTAAYTYSVDGVSTPSLTSGLAAGTHTILVRDANGCVFTRTFVIGTANGPSSFTVNTTNSNCGLANGTSTVSGVVGGTPTYSFSFDGGAFATTTTASGLLAGTHTVIVRDANSCTITATYSVSNNPPPTASVTSSLNILCNGASTGSLTVTPAGGTAPFTYTLTAPTQTNTTGAFTGLAAGAYSVTVRDNFGCIATVTRTLTQPTVVTATVSSIPVNCFGNSTGTVSAGGSGGVGPYTYLWPALGSSTLATVGGAAAGTYTVTIRDANLCTITRTVTVTQPTSLTLTSTLTPATCGNANGSGTVTVAGGTPAYNYNWSNGGSTNVLTLASAGTHTLTVQDFNGCILTRTVLITNIPGPTAIAGTTTQASCNTNNGTHNVTGVTGGTAVYTYSVDGVSTPSLTSGLAAGTHTILVRDANGCTFSTTFLIGTANGPSSFIVNTTNSNCGLANGTSTVSGVVGGTPTYSFSFDGGAFATTTTASGLLAGTHTVIVRDVNSCTITATYSVSNNPPPTASVTSSLNVLCNGTSTGSLTVTPAGGTAPFTYTLTSPTQTNTTGAFTGLPAGTYSINVRDNFGCIATTTVTLTQPTVVTATVSSIPVNCFGNSTGTVSAGGSGGVGPYTYLWPALGSSTLATVGGTAAGTYTVTIKDANLCTITRTVTVTQPTSLTLTSTLTPATCGNANGSGTVTVAGGTTTYNYNWSNGGLTNVLTAATAGTHTLTVQDFNGCILTRTVLIINIPGPTAIAGTTTQASCNTNNGTHNVTGVTGGTAAYTYSVDGVSTPSLTSNLAAGTHTVLVRDVNGCTFSTTFLIGTANGPSSFIVNTTNSNCGLANGTSTVSGVVGGTPTYSFSFDGGAFATTTTASGLLAGTHTVTVKDVNSCTITATYVVANNAPPTASVTSSLNVLCNGTSTGSLTVAPTGGTAPFTYTLTTPTQTNTTGAFTSLPVGTYSITLKDNFGCTATVTAIISQPTPVTATVSSIPVNCFGNSTGTVSAGGSGGVAPYTYLWPALGSSTLATVGGAAAGTYTVTIKDANLCTITRTVTVTQPTSLTLTSTLTPATCGNANGSGTVTVAGGTTTYNYNWSNGGLTNVLTAATAGTYTLTVQDFNGCILTRTVTVTNIPGPTAITGTTTLAGCGLLNGTHNVTGVTGGTAAYSYSVDGVSTPSLTSGLSAGTHTLLVSDANSCTFSTTFNINTANGPTSATIVTTDATCGAANGTSTVTGVTGGVAPYQYSFDGSAFAAGTTTTGLSAGTHTVIIRDVNSCTLAVTYTELNISGPTASVTSSLDVLCNGASTGSVTMSPAGGTAPFTYTLTAPTQTNTTGAFAGLPAGSYNMTVRDNFGCIATASVTLTQPTPVTLTVTSLPANCFGSATGTVSASGSGGVGPYTYLWPALASNTNATVNNVAAGTYSVTQTDFNGCPVTQSITVTQPTSLTLTSTLTPATCGNANGSGTVTVAGGTPAYTYSWSNGGITAALSGATAGTYTLNVTDFKACVLTATVTVTNIPGPTAITGTTTLAGCGLLNGTHNVTGVTGGTAAYSYSVDGVSTPSLTSGLSAGTHTILVNDANNCTFSTTFNINTANGPTSATVVTTNATCGAANGTSTVTGVTGGVAPYQYSFDGSAFAAGTTTTGLSAGTHTVIIRDVNSCTLAVTYTELNDSGPTASVTSSLDVLCNGTSTGSVTVTPTGGIAPFTYTLTAPTQTNATGAFTGLVAGSYVITVRDNSGCTATASVTLTQPTAVTLTVTSLPASCFGTSTGTVSASGSGGVGPYTYLWPALASNTNATVNNVAAGTYSVTQTDFNGCQITQSITVTQPTSLTLTSTLTPATCGNANGSGTVTVSGGTPAYSYNWSNGGISATLIGASAGTYTLNVTDFKACVLTTTVTVTNIPGPTAITGTTTLAGCGLLNGTHNVTGVTGGTAAYSYSVDGVSTPSLTSGLSAGTHTILVSDANNCTFSTTFNINTANGPTSATVITTNANCGAANGTATITGVTGGVAPYQYSFDGSAFAAGTTTTGLATGTHTLTVIDVNSCVLTVNYNVGDNPLPTATVTNSVNINCFAGNTGSFTVTAVTGIAPFTYSLTAPVQTNTTGVFTGLPAGAYNVTVSDNTGCTTTASVTLTEPTAVTLTVTSLPVDCFGALTGTVLASGSGGVGPYTYLWPALASNTNSNVNNVAAGTYSVTQTDANLCPITGTVTVTQPTSLTLTSTLTPATCGNANGSGTVSVSGGTPAYSFSWSNGGITSALAGASAGTYTLNVTDFKACVLTTTVTVTNIPGPTSITGTTTLAGCGLFNGTHNITGVTGGTPAYSYSVNGVTTGSLTSGLPAGAHTVSVSDLNNCLFSTTFIIGTTTGPATATVTSSNASCGNANGTSTVTGVTGGLAPYQYSFDGGAFGGSATTIGLISGTHTLSIQDANSCVLTINYNVLNNGTPTAAIVSTSNTSCFAGSDGGFTIAGSGGSGGPFTYTLTSPFQNNNTGIFTGLSAGTYSVITNDIAGCATTNTVDVSEPTLLSLTPTTLPAKCFGASTGTINVTGVGGTSPYQYSLNGAGYQVSSSYTAVGSAIYNVSIQDFNGCIATQTVQVTEPIALTIQVATQNANCSAANGVATTTVSGGTPIYTYTWTGGGGAAATSNSIAAGTYTVIATDANGCVISSPAVIGLTTGGTATISGLSNVTCNGANDGSMTASMLGGAAPFTYSWIPGGQTSSPATNLSPDTYTCTITDFYGCKAIAIGTITQPPVLIALMNSNNVKCFNTPTGTVTASGSGGTGPYTYLWTTIPSTLSTVSNVAIGNYPCNITDANGCTITQSITVTQPTSITLTSTVTTANCNQANGSATVIASGGAPGAYTYTWSSGSNAATQGSLFAGTYTIMVQDANNCIEIVSATIPNMVGPALSIASQTNVSCYGGTNGVATTSVSGGVSPYIYSWSNGNVSSIAPNLSSNIYTVSVTDQAGCVASTSVNITEPTLLTVGIVSINPKCFGAINGSGIAAALGGTPNYTYTWSDGGTSATSNPLGAGNYGLTVTDGNGCIVTSSMALINPPPMSASITSTNVTCFGACNGIAIATSTNGVGAVGYYWTGGASPIASQTANGLCLGTYTMVATDQNNCTASAIISISEPPVLTASILSGSVTCNGGTDGFASVSPTGGTPAYSYTWSGAAGPSGNSANANSLPGGTYTVTVMDTKGCTVSVNTTVLQPTPLATTLTTTNVKCNGVCDGTANIAFSGGAGTTTFLWQPGLQSGNFVNNLCTGNQTVTITSNGACPTVLTFTLTEPALLTAVASSTNSNCGQNNGKACAVVGGGTSPLNYQWSNTVTTLCNNNVVAGAYTFTVTDDNGCTATSSGLVNDIAGPVVSITGQTNVSCFNGMNGAATATISGGIPSYSVSWSGNQATSNTTTNPINFGMGLHNITVVDAAGCVGTASVNISEPTLLVSAIGSFTNVSCFGLSNGGATMLVNGGTTPYSYLWTPSAQTSSILVSVTSNTYVGGVVDANGCVTSQQVVISQPQALVMAASSFNNISCFGGSNGQISTTVQGGTPGYTYSWTPAQAGNNGVLGSLPAGGYTLSVIDTKTCSINANFTILEPSALTAAYTSLPAKCGIANGSATVTVGGGTPTYTLNWNTAPAQQGVIATNMAPGNNWQCVITDLNGCSITQTINVNNAPSPVFSSYVANQPSCFGLTNGDITLNYTSGTAPYTVIWSSPISQTITTSALTQSLSGIAQGAYTAILTDSYGCSTSQQVNVSQPGLLILLTNPDPTICYGQTSQLNASGQSGSPAYSYTWAPNPFIGGGPHTVNPTTTTSYTVSVSDTKGCSPSPKVITVNVTPQLSISGTSLTLCHGNAGILTPAITSPGNGGPYSYAWNPVGGSSSSITVIGNAPTIATTNTIALTVSDGCTIPSASTIFTVIANPLPTVTFTASAIEACAPAVINFTATPGSAGDYSYAWTSDDKDAMGTTNPISYLYTTPDSLSVKLVITNTLTGCSTTEIKTNYIVIHKQPVASFYADPMQASILDPNINFVNTSQGAISYFWDFGDPVAVNGLNNSIVTNPSHYYNVIGLYNVHLIAISNKGCRDTAKVVVEITPDFAIYIPNAFTPDGNGKNDIFQPAGVGINEEDYRLDIFDRWGENIFNSTSFRKGWDGTVKGGSKLAPQGVYIYKLYVTDLQGGKHPYVGHVTVIKKDN